ncbi:alpha-L-rhamnosidase [Terrimicrobium sacchariphilum]|uniref:Alpha-L-rhamnosidase n=1 Tax=Terrimicrobium sacchariphilum TaxID=690879 RepID=A0A146G334_TERSA|nr:alpha-L-rhamnosidase C-terminal domain-containing protein [Terrimicrobium sacchariphilum]GAT32245.1 alpha-L-rhamnosidase [Terrimicrobium sacchariphilum]
MKEALVKETPELFSKAARWIWDTSDRLSDHYYLRAKRAFRLGAKEWLRAQIPGASSLKITADAYYQVWLNGVVLGHGPAKSPPGERMVDAYDIGQWLVAGENMLEILVLSLGSGTMNYSLGEAGLIFEVQLPEANIASDEKTLVQRDARRKRRTVRRWIMPNIEDISQQRGSSRWEAAQVVSKECRLIPRPVRQASRYPLVPQRIVAHEVVKLPEFICSFLTKPYLVPPDQARRCNIFDTPAYIVTDLISEEDQTIAWLAAPGGARWYLEDRLIGVSSGWTRDEPGVPKVLLNLKKGANRLVGVHGNDHFSETHLAAFAPKPLSVRNPFGAGGFQVIPTTREEVERCGKRLGKDLSRRIAAGALPRMDSRHTSPGANFHDLVANAETLEKKSNSFLRTNLGWKLLPAVGNTAIRLIVDLGAVQNGWLAFKCFGHKGSTLIFSLVEAIDQGAPLTLNWPGPVNNSLRYELHDGWQSFESFFAYGGRYLIIHHQGEHSVALASVEMLSANCGNLPQGAFRSDNSMLNAIYALCEQTLISSTDDTLTDCPTYEAVNWNFDNRLGAMSDLVTMRNIPLLRNTIEQYGRDPQYPGLVRSHTPSAWDNRIPAFSFHWILLCREFYEHTGDQGFLETVFPQVARGLDESLQMIEPGGLMLWPADEEPWHIIDWHPDRDDIGRPFVSAEQALFVGALEAGAALAGSPAQARLWLDAARRLRESIHRRFWVPQRDAYADSIHQDGSISRVSSAASNAALAYYGVGSQAWRKRLLQRLTKEEGDLLPIGSPMGLFYVLEFLDLHGETEAIFTTILRKWSQMIEAGDKTAWEHFPEHENKRFPTRSRCHPFSTYILKYFRKYLLGIVPVGVGMKEFRFHPQPPSMVRKVDGALPTADGPIRISWHRDGRKVLSSIEAPKGVRQLS